MNMLLAFLMRDLAIERTYRFHLALKLSGVAAQLAVFFFVSRYLQKPEYFIFVFTGIMFSGFLQFWLNAFAEAVRQEQYWGTMEDVFLCPRAPLAVLLGSLSGKLLMLAGETALFMLLGKLFFGTGFKPHFLGFALLFALNALAFGGLGLISGSFILYFKRGDPVNWAAGAVLDLISGIYFPVSILPLSLAGISAALPTTSALNLWRDVLLNCKMPGAGALAEQALWALLFFSAGTAAFSLAFRKTREKGDLGSY